MDYLHLLPDRIVSGSLIDLDSTSSTRPWDVYVGVHWVCDPFVYVCEGSLPKSVTWSNGGKVEEKTWG